MIFDLFLSFIRTLLFGIVDLLPEFPEVVAWDFTWLTDPVGVLMYVMSKPIFAYAVLSLAFWLVAFPLFSLVKFIYVKIPGVN